MRKILIVVDYQKDAVCGSMGFPEAVALEPLLYNKIKQYQAQNHDVLFTFDTHYDSVYEVKQTMNGMQSNPQEGWELYGKIRELQNESSICISKHTYGSLDLLQFLLDRQYDEVEFAGVVTDVCVLANVILAQTALPDAKIIVDASCVASNQKQLHEKALDLLENLKIEIINRKRSVDMKNFDVKKETNACVQWIKDWFDNESGGAKGVVLGISGGKDSAVVAALLCKAIGKEKVFGVLLPNGVQSDISDSKRVCEVLQINHKEVNIAQAYEGILNCIESEGITVSAHTKTNIPPRLRMTVLYAIAQEMNYRVAGTGNYSEKYVGYCTKWGDTAHDFNPIGNFTTEQVIAIGKELGLPHDLVEKPPQDGLSGKTDEDNMGFTYAMVNRYIEIGECEDSEIKEKIEKRHQYNLHKFQPIPVYVPTYMK